MQQAFGRGLGLRRFARRGIAFDFFGLNELRGIFFAFFLAGKGFGFALPFRADASEGNRVAVAVDIDLPEFFGFFFPIFEIGRVAALRG